MKNSDKHTSSVYQKNEKIHAVLIRIFHHKLLASIHLALDPTNLWKHTGLRNSVQLEKYSIR